MAIEDSDLPAYPSDLTDAQWEKIRPLVEDFTGVSYNLAGASSGRRRSIDLRTIVNAILYQAFTGIDWRYLPRDIYPKWESVYKYAVKWESKESGITQKIFEVLNILPPEKEKGVPRARRARSKPTQGQ